MRERKRDWTTPALAVIALALAGVAWSRGGLQLALGGVVSGARTLLSVTPLLLAAFLIAGLTQVLVSREVVERWLGAGSGWRGLLLASLAGAVIPGGPYVYFPIAGALLQAGAALGVLLAFVTAKNLWTISRLPMEFALLGPHLTLIRFVLTLPIPLVVGFLAQALFGRLTERIREAVQ